MADRDKTRWQDDRQRSDYSERRPGGDRDFYGRDTRFEDDYGLGYGEEGATNYRLRDSDRGERFGSTNRPEGYRAYGGGSRDSLAGGSAGRGSYGGSAVGRGGWSRSQYDDFSRDFSSDQSFGYGRPENANPYGYTDRNADHRGRPGYGRADSGYDQDRSRYSQPRPEERGFWDRASDEVSSWFGDEEAERRRREDARHQGVGPKGYRRSDERIREDISDRLTEDPYINASEIEVNVEGGEVTLTGHVDSRNARRRAEDIAERISAVTHVQNNLRVTSGSDTTREEREGGVAATSTKSSSNVFGGSGLP
ncbi:BON domain-containing protein [Terrihabitans sp. B22-R8]|uniref:BON domain-containing protein n=1 Tax=Terrihabitans sp. B22-R8 TaxID=3425128 RepID=UPI00403D4823